MGGAIVGALFYCTLGKEIIVDICVRLARKKKPFPWSWLSKKTSLPQKEHFCLDVAFRGAERGITVLSGPSGAGKTTLIHCVAGLERPDSGRIVVGGLCLCDTEQGLYLPTYQRRVGYVFQEARLFPHYSVQGNLCYGCKARGVDKALFEEIIELLGITHLLQRKPYTLSGGEAQRVALGRALLSTPHVLLMDEPLASLDEERKQELMTFIKALNARFTVPMVYVSHDPHEVAFLAHTVVCIKNGRVDSVVQVEK